jgi:RsiW-degrading membrane proteinase PrsW (M82 family)
LPILPAISRGSLAVNRSNMLYLIVGALVIAVAVLGYQLYQDRHQPEGLHINVGPGGLSIQGK